MTNIQAETRAQALARIKQEDEREARLARRTAASIASTLEQTRAEHEQVTGYGQLNIVAWAGETLALGSHGRENIAALRFLAYEKPLLDRVVDGVFSFAGRWNHTPDYRASSSYLEEEYTEYLASVRDLSEALPDGLDDPHHDEARILREDAAEELGDLIWTAVQHGLWRGLTPDDITAGIEKVVAKNAAKTEANGWGWTEPEPGVRKIKQVR